MLRFLLLFILFIGSLEGSSLSLIPVNHQGRFRPLEVYSRFLLQEIYHAQEIRPQDMAQFPLPAPDALSFVIQLRLKGHAIFDDFPLFYVLSSELKTALRMQKERLSYHALMQAPKPASLSSEAEKEWEELVHKIALYEQGGYLPILPRRKHPLEWMDISQSVQPTHFLPELENHLRKAWQSLIKEPTGEKSQAFASAYWKAYEQLIEDASPHTFPSYWQLKAELLYYNFPMINYAIIAYLAALLFFLCPKKKRILAAGWCFFIAAFTLHSLTLLLRSYILGRPPVSNMSETVIYVPWIAVVIGVMLSKRLATKIPFLSSIAAAAILLTMREWTHGHDALENVQAVLNSAFWLTIHVLMVVGSYGVLILGGILAHVYLMQSRKNPTLSYAILQCLYLGCALLIPGTILGGVWAAQSWGRFWDWDPKESWAFISACVYLMIIHAYRFQKIGERGLAIGAIVGLMAISFTWYGVNYILGTGLHSYGFGSGGEWIYYSFLLGESAFLALYVLSKRQGAF
jgi:ABC-type transport system involved in cytochrome c biogenesis permease subunit